MIFLSKSESEGLAKLAKGELFVLIRNDESKFHRYSRRGKVKLYQPAMSSGELEFGLSHWNKLRPPNTENYKYTPAHLTQRNYPIKVQLQQLLPIVPELLQFDSTILQRTYKGVNNVADLFKYLKRNSKEISVNPHKPLLMLLMKKV